jgi:hypothetical protein
MNVMEGSVSNGNTIKAAEMKFLRRPVDRKRNETVSKK